MYKVGDKVVHKGKEYEIVELVGDTYRLNNHLSLVYGDELKISKEQKFEIGPFGCPTCLSTTFRNPGAGAKTCDCNNCKRYRGERVDVL